MSFLDTQFNPGQVAELIGCHRTTVLRKIRCGQIGATQIVNNRNQPEYQISISSLPPSAQEKYYAQQRAALALNVEPETAEPKASKPFDAYSEAEREEIVFWEHVVQQWGGYARKKGESEAELLERFLAWLRLEYPERSWSKATLYRKRKALEDGDLDGLVDGRGKTKGSRVKLEPEVAEVFRAFYLQETRHPNVQEAMWGAEEYLAAHMPDNGVLYDADKDWADTLSMVEAGLLKPELALAKKYDLPCETPEDLAAIREKYMPEMVQLTAQSGLR